MVSKRPPARAAAATAVLDDDGAIGRNGPGPDRNGELARWVAVGSTERRPGARDQTNVHGGIPEHHWESGKIIKILADLGEKTTENRSDVR
jgi:hypothetical protein